MSDLRFATINGADGAGKSTVARSLFEVMGGSAAGVHMLANMDYAAWASAEDVARYDEMIAIIDNFQEGRAHKIPQLGTFRRRERACNAIFQLMAQGCYESAANIIDSGGKVIMHSDPILKGIMWAKMAKRPQTHPWDALLEASRVKPDTVLHVTPHANPRTEEAAEALLARIIQRNGACADGAQNTGDPICLTDAQLRLVAAEDTAVHLSTRHHLPVETLVNDCLEQSLAETRAIDFAAQLLGQVSVGKGVAWAAA